MATTDYYAQFKDKRIFGATPEEILAEAKKTDPGQMPLSWSQYLNNTWQPFAYQASTTAPVSAPTTVAPLPTAKGVPSPVPTALETLKAYDSNTGKVVYVQPGKYYPGISLTPTTAPTTGIYVPDKDYLRYYTKDEIIKDPSGKIYLKPGVPQRWTETEKVTDKVDSKEANTLDEDLDKELSYQDWLKEQESRLPAQPAIPSLVETYKTEREKAGIGLLETDLTSVNDEIRRLNNELRATELEIDQSPISKTTAMARKAELRRNMAAVYDPLVEKQALLTDQLNVKNNNLNILMQLTGKDYDMTRSNYEFEVNKTLKFSEMFNDYEYKQLTLKQQNLENNRAQLTTMLNQFKDTGTNWNDLADYQKVSLETLAVKSGWGSGILETIMTNIQPEEKILSTTSYEDENNNHVVSIITKDAKGKVSVNNYVTGKVKPTGGGGVSGGGITEEENDIETLAYMYLRGEGLGSIGATKKAKVIARAEEIKKTPSEEWLRSKGYQTNVSYLPTSPIVKEWQAELKGQEITKSTSSGMSMDEFYNSL